MSLFSRIFSKKREEEEVSYEEPAWEEWTIIRDDIIDFLHRELGWKPDNDDKLDGELTAMGGSKGWMNLGIWFNGEEIGFVVDEKNGDLYLSKYDEMGRKFMKKDKYLGNIEFDVDVLRDNLKELLM